MALHVHVCATTLSGCTGQKVTHVYGSGTVILPLDLGWSEATVTPSDPFVASLQCTKHDIKGCLLHKLFELVSSAYELV